MANPSELTEELILANIKSELEEIKTGTSFWYTPQVIRVEQFLRAILDSTNSRVVYMIRDTSESDIIEGERDFGNNAKVLTVFMMLCYRDERADEDPWRNKAPTKGTIRNRMIRDVEIKLDEDGTRGGNATWTQVDTVTKDFDEGIGPWVFAEVAASVHFTHDYGAP